MNYDTKSLFKIVPNSRFHPLLTKNREMKLLQSCKAAPSGVRQVCDFQAIAVVGLSICKYLSIYLLPSPADEDPPIFSTFVCVRGKKLELGSRVFLFKFDFYNFHLPNNIYPPVQRRFFIPSGTPESSFCCFFCRIWAVPTWRRAIFWDQIQLGAGKNWTWWIQEKNRPSFWSAVPDAPLISFNNFGVEWMSQQTRKEQWPMFWVLNVYLGLMSVIRSLKYMDHCVG